MEHESLTGLVRDILVTPPVEEKDIVLGDHIIYAQGIPLGLIDVGLGKVAKVIDGKLHGGLRGFEGVLPNGSSGVYRINLDPRLQIHSMNEDTAVDILFDEIKATGGDQEIFANYEDGLLTLEWRAPHCKVKEGIKAHVVVDKDHGVSMVSRKDPESFRLGTPFACVTSDRNTVDIAIAGEKSRRIVQRIPDGPMGSFTLPGFRKISDSTYNSIVGLL